MRSAVVAMLVAGSIAAPSAHQRHQHLHKAREAQPDTVVTETAYTTVQAGQPTQTVQGQAVQVVTTVTVQAGQPSQAPQQPAPQQPAPQQPAPVKQQPAPPANNGPPAAYGPVAATGSAPAPPASSSPSTPQSGLSKFQQAALDAHNAHRANHSAPALTYDMGLEAAAKKVAARCHFSSGSNIDGHDVTVDQSSLGQYGQNLACNSDDGSDIANTIHSQWYNNEFSSYAPYFGQEPNWGTFSEWGHISQVIWAGSTKVGCAVQDCGSGGVAAMSGESLRSITYCNYGGPGNFKGAFSQNVKAPLGHAIQGGNAGAPSQQNAGYTENS